MLYRITYYIVHDLIMQSLVVFVSVIYKLCGAHCMAQTEYSKTLL